MKPLRTFTRRFLRFTLWGLVLIVGLLAANEGCSSYDFGIARRDYPAYFQPETPIYRAVTFNTQYGFMTMLPVGDKMLDVEHERVESASAFGPLRLPPGRYLFTRIKVWGTAVTSVQREYSYGGERLESVGGYLDRPRRLPTGERASSDLGWEKVPLSTLPQQEPGPFHLVWIYKLPEHARMAWYLPRAQWFDQPLVEHLVITQTQQGVTSTHEFTLEKHWHKCGTAWWTVLHAT